MTRKQEIIEEARIIERRLEDLCNQHINPIAEQKQLESLLEEYEQITRNKKQGKNFLRV